jgi:hypothetical protein
VKHQFKSNGTHYNGGAVWFGYGYTSTTDPRFSVIRKGLKKERRMVDEYYVDGKLVESYEEGVRMLRTPPVFTDAEKWALGEVREGRWGGFDLMWTLRAKGAIEYLEPRKPSLTKVGEEAIK